MRFVQLYSGGADQQLSWDAHDGIRENLEQHCPEIDRPVAGLIKDLKRRGLLDETCGSPTSAARSLIRLATVLY